MGYSGTSRKDLANFQQLDEFGPVAVFITSPRSPGQCQRLCVGGLSLKLGVA